MSVDGIDISYANPVVDFRKVKSSGNSFVIIRTGYKQKTDTMFMSHIKGALDAGLDVGVYCYCMAKTAAEARREAWHLLKLIKPYKLTYPIFYDIEDKSLEKLSRRTLTNIALAFLEIVRAEGYRAGVYANPSWLINKLDTDRLYKYDIWLAHWTYSPEKKTSYNFGQKMWQWGTKKIEGVMGEVDADICYEEYGGKKEEEKPPMSFTALADLNLRFAPSVRAPSLTTIPTGEVVERIDENEVSADGYKWWHVSYNDKVGYCAEKYLHNADEVSLYVTTANLNVRERPVVASKALGTIPKGRKIVRTSLSEHSADSYKWFSVSNGDISGYCASEYLRRL